MARFKIEDREYEFDGEFTAAEAMQFFDRAHIGMAQVDAELERWNPYAIVTFMHILKTRAGEKVRWEDLMSLPVRVFTPVIEDTSSVDGEPNPAEGQREAQDPTRDAGTTPESDTTST
jgi:hypothetical protein